MKVPRTIVDTIRERGWSQGSLVIGSDLSIDGLDGRTYVLLDHPCDIVATDLSREPWVHVLPLNEVGQVDGNFTFGKNPRRLHFDGNPVSFELNIAELQRLPRERLAAVYPSGSITPHEVTILGRWLAARWSRSAFPDEFNRRLAPIRSALVADLKELGSRITGLYFATDFRELDAASIYDVVVLLTVGAADYENALIAADAEELADRIGASIERCDGMALIASRVQSERATSLDELRVFRRWDADSLSLRDEGATPTLPAI